MTDNHAELMELSKDIGKVDSRVSSIEAGVTALSNKQSEDMNYVHSRFHDVLSDMQKGFARIDKQHLELMIAIKGMNETSTENSRVIEEIKPTVEFVEKWRQRWLAVALTAIGLGGLVSWVMTNIPALRDTVSK